jgi:hypothetical protein
VEISATSPTLAVSFSQLQPDSPSLASLLRSLISSLLFCPPGL